MSDKLDCIVLPRDFWERGALGKGAAGEAGSSEEPSVLFERTDSLPGAGGRAGVEFGTAGVEETAGFSGARVSAGDGRF